MKEILFLLYQEKHQVYSYIDFDLPEVYCPIKMIKLGKKLGGIYNSSCF